MHTEYYKEVENQMWHFLQENQGLNIGEAEARRSVAKLTGQLDSLRSSVAEGGGDTTRQATRGLQEDIERLRGEETRLKTENERLRGEETRLKRSLEESCQAQDSLPDTNRRLLGEIERKAAETRAG